MRNLARSCLLIATLLITDLAVATPLRDALASELARQELVGLVWATVTPDSGRTVGAVGLRDARSPRALTPDDRVQVGSIAKPLLTTGILRLVTQGRVSLDAPVSRLLPDIRFDNPWEETAPVRLRHLLDHTSGLDDARLWHVFSLQANPDTALHEVFSRDRSVLRIRSRPGSRFSYSNMGFTLVGRVIETITGERYETYLDKHLLRPLGMNDSTFGFVSQQGEHADPRLVMGHFERGQPQPTIPTFIRPAGQFTTTAADMARFAQFLMSDGRVDRDDFIQPALLRAMGRSPHTEAASAGLVVGYGLGLYTRDRNGAVGGCHGGSTIGFRAMLCVFPKHQRAYFWSVNTDSENGNPDAFDALLLEQIDQKNEALAYPADPETDLRDWEGLYVPSPNRFATLALMDRLFSAVTVRKTDDGLGWKTLQSPEISLEPVGHHQFRAPGRTLASHALLLSQDGKRVATTGTLSFEQHSRTKYVLLWASLALGLAGLAWLLVSGAWRLLRRRLPARHPVFFPWLGVVVLALPVPFFITQSFLKLGDFTTASALTAMVTLSMPLAMLTGLVKMRLARRRGGIALMDALAMLAVLQWTLVLAYWDLWPLRLWI